VYTLTGKQINAAYYTYVLINPLTNKPFYVGKGTEQRYLDHFKEAITNKTRNKYKTNTIKRILKENKQVVIDIVFTSDIESKCFEQEKHLIAKYGRKDNKTGILTNLTDGGEGVSGVDRSDERNSMFGKSHSAFSREKISKTRKEKLISGEIIPKKHTEEHKQKLRKNNPGGKATSKPIYQIDATTGKVLKEWPSTRQAGLSLGIKTWRNISQSANKHKGRVVGGFYWRWTIDKDVIANMLANIQTLNSIRLDPGRRSGKAVQQLTPNGILVDSYKNMCEAARQLGIDNTSISVAIKRGRPCAGFLWKMSK